MQMMIPVDEALNIMLQCATPLPSETIPFLDASGRVLYDNIKSEIDVPPLDNSAMDGYAVCFEDTRGAEKNNPVKLRIMDEIKAGDFSDSLALTRGHAIRIMTGAPIPRGADSVIPVEDTTEEGDQVLLFKTLKKNENIRFAGEDIQSGQIVLKQGDILRSAHVGLLASLNYEQVRVYRRPSVAVISTGNEVVDVGSPIRKGQIRNSNAYTLYSEIKKYGAIPHYRGIARDTFEETKRMFQDSLEHDIIITTGGVSMGKYDFVKNVMHDMQIDVKIETIAMKPGKPVVFGTLGNTLFFGLPGNPVSTMIAFIEFVRPVILRMMGMRQVDKPLINAVCDEDISKKPGRRHYIRAFFYTDVTGDLRVSTTGPQGSGILRSMSQANCLIILPETIEKLHKGEKVLIQLINHEEI
jgi:molybdopterin molybdotransferase